MAITTKVYSPLDRNPDYARGEWQYLHLIGDGSEQCFDGYGELGDIISNIAVAGTVQFYDAATGDSVDATNRIVLIDTTALGPLKKAGTWTVQKGLRVVTSAATQDVTFQLRGRQTLSPRTYP